VADHPGFWPVKDHKRVFRSLSVLFSLTGAENVYVARSLRRSPRQGAPRSELAGPMHLALGLPLHPARRCYILNHMVQCQSAQLDVSFAALSDATRRGVLEQLSRADASITDLAGKFHMTLTGMKKHVAVLERAALVTTEKAGRVRTCRLAMRALEEEAAWIERHRQLWSARFDALDKIVEHLKSKEKADARRKRR
jgi:DNA-binding transcriptional ArsR family regulator